MLMLLFDKKLDRSTIFCIGAYLHITHIKRCLVTSRRKTAGLFEDCPTCIGFLLKHDVTVSANAIVLTLNSEH